MVLKKTFEALQRYYDQRQRVNLAYHSLLKSISSYDGPTDVQLTPYKSSEPSDSAMSSSMPNMPNVFCQATYYKHFGSLDLLEFRVIEKTDKLLTEKEINALSKGYAGADSHVRLGNNRPNYSHPLHSIDIGFGEQEIALNIYSMWTSIDNFFKDDELAQHLMGLVGINYQPGMKEIEKSCSIPVGLQIQAYLHLRDKLNSQSPFWASGGDHNNHVFFLKEHEIAENGKSRKYEKTYERTIVFERKNKNGISARNVKQMLSSIISRGIPLDTMEWNVEKSKKQLHSTSSVSFSGSSCDDDFLRITLPAILAMTSSGN